MQIISPCNQYNKNQILLQVLSQSGGCRVIDIAMSLCCLTFTVKGIISGIIFCIYLLLILSRLVLSYLVSPNGVLSYLVPSHGIFYILLLCCILSNHLYLHRYLHLHMICCFGLISYTETSISTYSFFHPSLGARWRRCLARCGGSQQQRSQGDHLLLNEADAAQPGGFSGFVTISWGFRFHGNIMWVL